jgi:hypothetical protein
MILAAGVVISSVLGGVGAYVGHDAITDFVELAGIAEPKTNGKDTARTLRREVEKSWQENQKFAQNVEACAEQKRGLEAENGLLHRSVAALKKELGDAETTRKELTKAKATIVALEAELKTRPPAGQARVEIKEVVKEKLVKVPEVRTVEKKVACPAASLKCEPVVRDSPVNASLARCVRHMRYCQSWGTAPPPSYCDY